MTGKFPRKQRLRTNTQFKQVLSEGKRLRAMPASVYTRKNALDFARLGVSVSKRHYHRAVDRNRIKRLLREQFRHCKESFGGYDVVIILSRSSKTLSYEQLKLKMGDTWEKLANVCKAS